MSKLANNTEELNEILAVVNALPEAKEYTLPVATETALGGVKAPAKTDGMTQPVGVDGEGFLFVTPAEKVNIPTALPNPNALTFTGAVEGTYDGSEPKEIHIPEAKEYTLPAASETDLGGVKASIKTEDMTQPVGIGEDGFLFTAPGGSGGAGDNRFELIADVTAETDVVEMSISEDLNGNPFALSRCLVVVDAHPALEEDSNPGTAYVVGFNVSGSTWTKGLVKYASPGNTVDQHSWRTTLVSTTIDGLVVPENVTVSYNNNSMPNAQGYLSGLSPETRFPNSVTGFAEDAYRAKTGINNVSIGSYVKSIGANTRMIVYGVRM